MLHQGRWAALATALALVVLVACSADDPPGTPSSTTSEPGSASPGASTTGPGTGAQWSLGLDSQPTRAVVNGDRIYLSSAGSARFPPQIYLVDATTGQEIAHRTATGQPYDLLVAPNGRLWVAGDRHPDQAGGAGINVLNPETLVVIDHADLPAPAYSLAQVGAEVWVGSDNMIFALDPETLDVTRTIAIGGPAYVLVALSSTEIVAVEGNLLELVLADGTVSASQPVDADGNIVAAASATAVWARIPVGADSTVLTLDPGLAEPGQPIGVDLDSTGGGVLVTSSGDVVLVDDRSDEVVCIPSGVPPPATIPATDLVGVLAELTDGRLLFATSSGTAVRDIAC